MKPVKQKDPFGCGIACVAFILDISYQDSLRFFKDGKKKAQNIGFFCKEIVSVLKKAGLPYEYKYVKNKIKKKIYKSGSIVFLKRSRKYPTGHYVCRAESKWMDPWINFPREDIKAGFRTRLPEKPIYAILKTKNSY